jgi:hypothetical protein
VKILRPFRTHTAALTLAVFFALAAHVSPTSARATVMATQEQEKYRVFCVNGKVDFGSRTLKEMQWDFGKGVCQLSEFDSYREAKDDVRRRGGVGADCSCPQ